MQEIAWLIERSIDGNAHWMTEDGWSMDSLLAIRFSRETDAKRMISAIRNIMGGAPRTDWKATQHKWL